jgi:8-oxo-dGTP pyrophosphatase MutT (NUDIX family)
MNIPHRWHSSLCHWNQEHQLTVSVENGQTVPLSFAGTRLGYVSSVLALRLARDFGDVFQRAQDLSFSPEFVAASIVTRSNSIARVMHALRQDGTLTGWRDECVDVAYTYGQAPLFAIERASSRLLGLVAYAAHLNGVTQKDEQDALWIATRSAKKAIDPGKFDNLVGGRIAAGFSALQTIRKEAWEEAGLAAPMAATIVSTGAIALCYPTEEGWHREVLFTHDIHLPPDFVPQNQDGEVAGFTCLTTSELVPLTTHASFTPDAAAVCVDWLIRRGHIAAEHPDYLALHRALAPR